MCRVTINRKNGVLHDLTPFDTGRGNHWDADAAALGDCFQAMTVAKI